MKRPTTPVNKRVTVYRSRNGKGTIFAVPTPEPVIIGYVVRYENGGAAGGPSEPLDLNLDYGGVLLINTGGELGGPGTIFPTFEGAKDAVIRSIKYQVSNDCQWNAMYGNYLIDPVIIR